MDSNSRPLEDFDVSKLVYELDALREARRRNGEAEDSDLRKRIDYVGDVLLYGCFTHKYFRQSVRLPAPFGVADLLRKLGMIPSVDGTAALNEDDEAWLKIKLDYDISRYDKGVGRSGRSR